MPKTIRATSAEQLARWMQDPETILADVLKAQTEGRKRTDPLPLWRVKVWREGRERRQKEKKREALARVLARYKATPRTKGVIGHNVKHKAIDVMEPGKWYALKDLARATGLPTTSSGWLGRQLTEIAWAERTANSAWDPRPVDPWRMMGGAVREPKWLYRLTPEGEQVKAGMPPRLSPVNIPRTSE